MRVKATVRPEIIPLKEKRLREAKKETVVVTWDNPIKWILSLKRFNLFKIYNSVDGTQLLMSKQKVVWWNNYFLNGYEIRRFLFLLRTSLIGLSPGRMIRGSSFIEVSCNDLSFLGQQQQQQQQQQQITLLITSFRAIYQESFTSSRHRAMLLLLLFFVNWFRCVKKESFPFFSSWKKGWFGGLSDSVHHTWQRRKERMKFLTTPLFLQTNNDRKR